MDFIKRETSPFVQTQPLQNAQGPITLSDVEPTTDTTTAHDGTKTAINGVELPVKSSSSAPSQSSGSQDKSSFQTPKASQASSKILDKVRAFEEQRHSSNIPKVSSLRLSWGFNRTSSCNSEDSRSKSRKLQDNSKSDVALKRSFFKQKASSLEEQSTYVQKHFQSKVSEELHRIKNLVGKSNIKKAFSMDQLTQTDKQSTGNNDSVPAQVIKKVEETTNLKDLPESKKRWSALPKRESPKLQKKKLADESKQPERKSPPDITESQWRKHSKPRRLLDRQVINENVTFSKIPGQCSPMVQRTNMFSKLPKSPVEIAPAQPIMQGDLVQAPQKPPRLFGSIPVLPKSFKEREEKKDSSLIPKMTIPTIVVENKPVDEEAHKAEKCRKEVKHEGKITRRNRGKTSSNKPLFLKTHRVKYKV